jgi:hypothetical protein
MISGKILITKYVNALRRILMFFLLLDFLDFLFLPCFFII